MTHEQATQLATHLYQLTLTTHLSLLPLTPKAHPPQWALLVQQPSDQLGVIITGTDDYNALLASPPPAWHWQASLWQAPHFTRPRSS
jgi:hypothetical protein